MNRRIQSFGTARQRCAAFLPLGAFAVHQLRFSLGESSQASRQMAAEGHSYLGYVSHPLAVIAAVGLGLFVARVAQSWRSGEAENQLASSFFTLWILIATGLVAIFTGQELFEGLLATGRPGGIDGVYGADGWLAIPIALIIAALLALLLRGASAVISWAATHGRSDRTRFKRIKIRARAPRVIESRTHLLAKLAAGRAPPLRTLLSH